MKKYHFIYLFFLCFVAISCENTVIEEEIPATSATTRSTPEELGYYGSNFRNVVVRTSKYGSDEMSADFDVYPAAGSEYSCTLGSSVGNEGVKSKVSVSGATIIYNGREDTYLYGTGGQIKFIIKTNSSSPKVTLNFEVPSPTPDDSRVSARLVITQRQYRGEDLPTISGGVPDLNITAFYGGIPHEAKIEWICNSCYTWNNYNNSTCGSCGKNKGSY